MKRKEIKTNNDYIQERLQSVEKMYNDLIIDYATATIEKSLNEKTKNDFQARWDNIAKKWNHWNQIGMNFLKIKKLVNPNKIEYKKLRKIYNSNQK